jgi:hypothetical protein
MKTVSPPIIKSIGRLNHEALSFSIKGWMRQPGDNHRASGFHLPQVTSINQSSFSPCNPLKLGRITFSRSYFRTFALSHIRTSMKLHPEFRILYKSYAVGIKDPAQFSCRRPEDRSSFKDCPQSAGGGRRSERCGAVRQTTGE